MDTDLTTTDTATERSVGAECAVAFAVAAASVAGTFAALAAIGWTMQRIENRRTKKAAQEN